MSAGKLIPAALQVDIHIRRLKRRYQGGSTGEASISYLVTLIYLRSDVEKVVNDAFLSQYF
jgi:hypothetical protein